MNEEKKCSECNWYGVMSCECPLPCNDDSKKYWEKLDSVNCGEITECKYYSETP